MNRYNYRDDKVDKWFEWKGVKPPERIAHMTEDELDDKLRQLAADHRCHWYQVGPDIECDASPNYTHGKRIGVSLRLDGTDSKGMPVLVKWGPILKNSV